MLFIVILLKNDVMSRYEIISGVATTKEFLPDENKAHVVDNSELSR